MSGRSVPCPAPRGVAVVVLLAVLGALVPIVPFLAPAWRIAMAVLVVLFVIEWFTRPRRASITVERGVVGELRVGYPMTVTTTVTNHASASVLVILRETCPVNFEAHEREWTVRLGPGESATGETTGVPLARGPLQFPAVGVGVVRGFGLIEFRSSRDRGRRFSVAPGRPSAEQSELVAMVAGLHERGEVPLRQLRGEWEFESLREYQIGDEPRTIDWRASARRHEPVTRQYEAEHSAEMLLAIDLGRLMGARVDGVSKADLAMVALLDLAAVGCYRGERVGLLAFDSEPRVYLPPRTGWRHLEQITRELAGIEQRDTSTSFVRAVDLIDRRHRRRSLCVFFTDFLDEITGVEMFSSLGAVQRRHELLFVGVGDPHVGAVFDAGTENVAGLFEKAVAGQLLVERARALRRFEDMGIEVVDGDPRHLTAPLLRRYLSMRFARPRSARA